MLDLSKEQMLSCMFESFPGKIVVRDLEGRSLYSNSNHEESPSSSSCSSCPPSPLIVCKEEKKHTEKEEQSRENLYFPVKDSFGNVIANCSVDFTTTEEEEEEEEDNHSAPTTSTTADDPAQLIKEEEEEEETIAIAIAEEQETKIEIYQTIMEKIQTAISLNEVVVDKHNQPIDYIFLYVNPAFENFLGITAQECIGKRVTEVIPGIEQDRVDWIRFFGNVGVNHVTEEFTQYSQRLENWYTGICYSTNPKRHGFAVLFHESSQHMQSQEALRESEERHRNLFESMMQGVVYQDSDGNIISANPAAERILGLTLDQMMGRTSVDPRWKAIREDGSEFPGHEHPSMVALKTGKPVLNQIMGVFSPKENTNRWIKVDAVPRFRSSSTLRDSNGNLTERPQEQPTPWQVHATFTDITETKIFEDKLLKAKQRAEESDKLKSAFLANMSHEIRTPLNGIMGHIDLALSNDLEQQWRLENLEGLRIAKTSGSLLLSIIQDILDLSKIEAGQMIVHSDESFSMKTTVEQTTSLAKTLILSKNKGIRFECSMDERIHDVVHGDPFRLQQVVNNLVSNSIKFTAKGKVELRISLLEDQNMIEFALLDTGKGIPASHIEKIFEPFRQVEISDTRQHGGTGLGLTISRKLIEMMGGSLRVESSVLGPIRGSLFAFTLPYLPQKETATAPSPQPSKSSGLDASQKSNEESNDSDNASSNGISTTLRRRGSRREDGTKMKILVAEDDPVSRKLVGRMLQRTGYDVIYACDGEEAVEICMSRHRELALVLMDGQMPKLSGHEATKQIRQHEKDLGQGASSIPIVGLSAGAMKGDHERGLSYGMTDYLTKPVDFSNLVVTLEKYLGAKPRT